MGHMFPRRPIKQPNTYEDSRVNQQQRSLSGSASALPPHHSSSRSLFRHARPVFGFAALARNASGTKHLSRLSRSAAVTTLRCRRATTAS